MLCCSIQLCANNLVICYNCQDKSNKLCTTLKCDLCMYPEDMIKILSPCFNILRDSSRLKHQSIKSQSFPILFSFLMTCNKCSRSVLSIVFYFHTFQESFCSDNTHSGSGVLSGVPTALSRWTEESHVLEGDSMHDCVTGTF